MTVTLEIDAAILPTRPRMSAHAIWDNIARPVTTDPAEVPWHGEAVGADWLTAIVADKSAEARVLEVRVVRGDDGSSARRILDLTWNEVGLALGLPTRLFTKSTPTLPMRISAGKAAPSEGRFLTELRPALAIEAPYCLCTLRDPRSGRSFHLMEDLTTTRGATFCSADSDIDRGQAEQIIDSLATLHGTFLAPSRDVDFGWLRTYEDFFHAAARNGIQQGHDRAMELAADVIPSSVTAHKDRIWPAAEASLAMHESQPRTVIHSDVHLGNWYITDQGRMGLSDWARVCRGHWARDLAYALMTTVTIEDRRTWERELIERYCAQLSEHVAETITFATAWEGYRRQAAVALLMWTPTLCPPPTLPDMQPEATSRLMIERITTAMDDLDVLAEN
ncbi:MAG: aminoglycoside phosphotransferase (APT) family kinase protein [Candidatus Azotimanducaceae bacterium]|jgi:aminoglycoside phosphotransferase (APT) family kinase protein